VEASLKRVDAPNKGTSQPIAIAIAIDPPLFQLQFTKEVGP
jgi:hypothetical protein